MITGAAKHSTAYYVALRTISRATCLWLPLSLGFQGQHPHVIEHRWVTGATTTPSSSTKTDLMMFSKRRFAATQGGLDELSRNGNEIIANTVSSSSSNRKKIDWNDRIGLQNLWTNDVKGWKVNVEWKQTPYGAGLFAKEDISDGTTLRVGLNGRNLLQFRNLDDIKAFLKQGQQHEGKQAGRKSMGDDDEYKSRLLYVKDYLWGFNPNADERGYDFSGENYSETQNHFFGMWYVRCNVLHSTPYAKNILTFVLYPSLPPYASLDLSIAPFVSFSALT